MFVHLSVSVSMSLYACLCVFWTMEEVEQVEEDMKEEEEEGSMEALLWRVEMVEETEE